MYIIYIIYYLNKINENIPQKYLKYEKNHIIIFLLSFSFFHEKTYLFEI